MKHIKKIFTCSFLILLFTVLIFGKNVAAFADDNNIPPTPPAQPTAPSTPTPPDEPTPPTPPAQPTAPTQQSTTSPTTPSVSPTTDPTSPTDPTTSNNGVLSASHTTLVNQNSQSNTQQNNGQSADSVNSSSNTGNNSSSDNVGNSAVSTQDANTSGTLVNGVNTNLNNVSVSEFNVNGDHNGDIVLDFPTNCTLHCDTSSTTNAQTNTAGVGNTLTLSANSGNNNASENTSGASAISTGNANVDANSLAFANNNLDGQVEFGVVNIYGNLNGDIILPDSAVASSCSSDCTTGNNTGTQNNSQTNSAGITNVIKTAATTGDNSTGENTTGDNAIQTGQGSVDANELTLANNNLDGGTYWLVLVNNDGNWNGQLLGGDGNTASSPGLNFSLNPGGDIATTDNGAGSQNTTTVTDSSANTSIQTNTAGVQNVLDLSANTGGNHADLNTGGPSTVKTGNAKIMANLVDFVNNNLSHGAKLIVTVVNVFGNWVGDFVTPGHAKQNHSNATANSNDNNTATTASNNTSTTATQLTPPYPTTPAVVPPTSVDNGNITAVLATAQNPITTRVAGIQNTTEKVANTLKHVVHINLAWAIIILPLLAVANLLRKKIFIRRKSTI